jgi:hypothetical protein
LQQSACAATRAAAAGAGAGAGGRRLPAPPAAPRDWLRSTRLLVRPPYFENQKFEMPAILVSAAAPAGLGAALMRALPGLTIKSVREDACFTARVPEFSTLPPAAFLLLDAEEAAGALSARLHALCASAPVAALFLSSAGAARAWAAAQAAAAAPPALIVLPAPASAAALAAAMLSLRESASRARLASARASFSAAAAASAEPSRAVAAALLHRAGAAPGADGARLRLLVDCASSLSGLVARLADAAAQPDAAAATRALAGRLTVSGAETELLAAFFDARRLAAARAIAEAEEAGDGGGGGGGGGAWA